MAVNRYYSSTAQETTLSAGIAAGDASMMVGGVTGWPTQYPYLLIIDRATASEELVDVTNVVGTTATVTRGVDGTSAVSHSTGATVVHGGSGRDLREPQQHIAATTGVHGLSGALVGTTDAQTLTNKTLTSPVVTTPTVTNPTITGGGSWAGSPTLTTPTIADLTGVQHNHSNAAGGGSTLTSPTVNTPTITNPTVTGGGSWAGSPTLTTPTITTPTVNSGGTLNGTYGGSPTFSGQPTISDLTNIPHTHSNAANGGSTLTSPTIATPTITTPTVTNGTINGTRVVGALLKDNSGSAYTWQTPSLGSGWSQGPAVGSAQSMRYRLDSQDQLVIQGCIHSTSATPSSTIFTLPSGYRPAATQNPGCVQNGGGTITAHTLNIDSSTGVIVLTANFTVSGHDLYVYTAVPMGNIS